jgi:hypothetical protein
MQRDQLNAYPQARGAELVEHDNEVSFGRDRTGKLPKLVGTLGDASSSLRHVCCRGPSGARTDGPARGVDHADASGRLPGRLEDAYDQDHLTSRSSRVRREVPRAGPAGRVEAASSSSRLPRDHSAQSVGDLLFGAFAELPGGRRRTLSWGSRQRDVPPPARRTHTGVKIYFCDPQSPQQRGSNEMPTACSGNTSREPTSASGPPTSSTGRRRTQRPPPPLPRRPNIPPSSARMDTSASHDNHSRRSVEAAQDRQRRLPGNPLPKLIGPMSDLQDIDISGSSSTTPSALARTASSPRML